MSLRWSRANLSGTSCGYRGHPPVRFWRNGAHRVCLRGEMGPVLGATPDAAPRQDDPLATVDEQPKTAAMPAPAAERSALAAVSDGVTVGGQLCP